MRIFLLLTLLIISLATATATASSLFEAEKEAAIEKRKPIPEIENKEKEYSSSSSLTDINTRNKENNAKYHRDRTNINNNRYLKTGIRTRQKRPPIAKLVTTKKNILRDKVLQTQYSIQKAQQNLVDRTKTVVGGIVTGGAGGGARRPIMKSKSSSVCGSLGVSGDFADFCDIASGNPLIWLPLILFSLYGLFTFLSTSTITSTVAPTPAAT